MKRIEQTYVIEAPLSEVWQAFVDPNIIKKWGGGPAKMNEKEGAKFTLWGGSIYGTNIKVIPNKLLEQDWTSGKWEKPSHAVFEFSESNKKTTIKLTHTNIPDYDTKDIKRGWDDYYLGPIKELLEQ